MPHEGPETASRTRSGYRTPTIYVVADHPDARASLARRLTAIGVPIEAHSSESVFSSATAPHTPGCIVIDATDSDAGWPSLLGALATSGSLLVAVALVAGGDVPAAVRALRSGAADVLETPADPAALVATVRSALARSSAAMARSAGRRDAAARFAELDPQTTEILRLAVKGVPNKAIARRVGLAIRSVERRRSAGLRAIGASRVVEIAWLFQGAANGGAEEGGLNRGRPDGVVST